jgi:hypothetical protein
VNFNVIGWHAGLLCSMFSRNVGLVVVVQVWCRCGAGVVQVWCRCGAGVVQVWCGVVWCGVVWCRCGAGVVQVWCGVVWCGVCSFGRYLCGGGSVCLYGHVCVRATV